MKSFIIAILLYGIQIGGIVYGTYWGQKEFLNLGLWAVWFCIIISIIGLFYPSKGLYKTNQEGPQKWLVRSLSFALTLTLILTGHFVTGTVWVICWISLWLKRGIYKEELKKSTDK